VTRRVLGGPFRRVGHDVPASIRRNLLFRKWGLWKRERIRAGRVKVIADGEEAVMRNGLWLPASVRAAILGNLQATASPDSADTCVRGEINESDSAWDLPPPLEGVVLT
jgi:hypothetical protein